MKITSLRSILGSLFISVLVAVPAGADIYNFGADIGGNTIYADGSDYSAAAGMGWTFKTDPGVAPADSPDLLFQDKRAAYPAVDPDIATDVLDIREPAVVATDKDYFTWRIDLPNGRYDVTAMAGLASASSIADVVVADSFNSTGNTGALDKSDTATQQLLLSGVIAAGTNTIGDTKTQFVVDGYMLIGLRRRPGLAYFGVMNTIEIVLHGEVDPPLFHYGDANGDGVVSAGDFAAVQAAFGTVYTTSSTSTTPEPATMIMLGLGGLALIRRKRA